MTKDQYITTLEAGLIAVRQLIDDSHGVYGLHRNGDPAPWDELRGTGRFCEWLAPLDDALDAIEGRETTYEPPLLRDILRPVVGQLLNPKRPHLAIIDDEVI